MESEIYETITVYPSTEQTYYYPSFNGTPTAIPDMTLGHDCVVKSWRGWIKVMFSILISILICFGVFGNSLVLIVVIRKPKMRTVINYFICNLAVSDIMFSVVGVPTTIGNVLARHWYFGTPVCRVAQMITAFYVLVASLTLTVIAVDRFCLVVYPFLKPINRNRCFVIIAVIWIFSFALTIPHGVNAHVFDTTRFYVDGAIICSQFWENLTLRKTWNISVSLLQFFIPLIIVSLAHFCIAWKLHHNVKPGVRRRDSEFRENSRRQKMNRMLTAVVILFAICWVPLNVLSFIEDLNLGSPYSPPSCLVSVLIFMPCVCSTFTNPILYAWLNDNFKKEFIKLIPCLATIFEANGSSIAGTHVSGAFTKSQARPTQGTYLQPTMAENSTIKQSPMAQRKSFQDTKI